MPSGYEKSPDYGDPPPNPGERIVWAILILIVVAIFVRPLLF